MLERVKWDIECVVHRDESEPYICSKCARLVNRAISLEVPYMYSHPSGSLSTDTAVATLCRKCLVEMVEAINSHLEYCRKETVGK